MNEFTFNERRLIISNSSKINNSTIPYLNSYLKKNQKIFIHRINLIKTIKTYIKKYYDFAPNKNNILYLSILYLDIIISKDQISLSYDKNLKYLCLCCFILSLKFLGDYDLTKNIIRNFCENYKNEYSIFETQCVQLLDYNLIYTTAYDYLNIILNENQKNLLVVCISILNKICENDLYLFYSPFYIAIVTIQLGKNYLNDKSYNYYDKYFNDQRVIFLYKNFNQNNINITYPFVTNLEEKKIYNKKYYEKNKYNNMSNINIFTNNNIQNNIIIINKYENNENINNNKKYNAKTYLKTVNSNRNIDPLKIVVDKYNNNKKINNIKSMKESCKCNYNNNTYRITRLRPHKSKNENNFRCRNSFNNIFNLNYNRSINDKDDEKEYTTHRITKIINNENIRNQNKSITNINNINSKAKFSNENSLNFKFLSKVPKEVLFRITKNISKTLGSCIDNI